MSALLAEVCWVCVLCVKIKKTRLCHPLVVASGLVSKLLPLWFRSISSSEAFFQTLFPFFHIRVTSFFIFDELDG